MGNSTEERLPLLGEPDGSDLKKRVWNESKKLWKIAFPGMVARVTSFGMIVVTQLFLGHVSELDLAAYGLQQSILLRFANGILIVGWFSASSFVVHVLLSWLFVMKLGFGLAGAMSAFIISSYLLVIGEFVYIFGGWCPNTWKGFTKAAFADMFPLIKLSISSGIMICLELWYSSILVLLAGYMKNATVAISAFSICLNINAWEFMICLGFLGSSCVRVSNELGSGNAKAAKFSIMVALGTSIIIGVIFWILCLIFSREISYLFTSSEEVAESVSSLHVLLAFSMLLNSVYPVLSGVAIGAGVQSMVAFVNLGSYYVIGLPVGILLGYVAHLQVTGLWVGLLSGVVVQTLLLSYLTWRIDWEEQVNKASERLGRFFIETTEGSDESSNLA
ncbi:hypothetical protein OIU76_016437 [Salix suchowensis]|nr:hypothetical protein OIU76_016437 [Salix suchowensis]